MGVINIVAALVYAKKTKEKIEAENKRNRQTKKPVKKKPVKSLRDIKINHGFGSLEDKL